MLKYFKAYDIRGHVPDELNEDLAYRIGRAFAQVVTPAEVVVDSDVRVDSPLLAVAMRGLHDSRVA